MRRWLAVVAALVGLVVVAAPVPASAAINDFTVTTTADGARIVGSLRWALTRSEQVDGLITIALQPGQTYVLNRCAALSEDVGATGDLDVDIDGVLDIDGNGATIQQTCAGERVLHATGGDLVTDDLVVTGGDAEPDANQADPQGGGILAPDVTLRHTTVIGNASTASGGGVKTDHLVLAGSELRDNTSGLNGGGAAVAGSVLVNKSIVTGNTAGEGGGIAAGIGTISVDTSIVADNVETAPGVGTADGVDLDVFTGTIQLLHTTVRGGDGDGPAIRGNATLTASVVSQGQADAACGVGDDTSNGNNADDDGSCDLDQGTDQPDVADVGLGGDLLPLADSVLRDHEITCVNFVDLRGVRRPQGPGCEIGALELDHHPDGELRRTGIGRFVGNDVFNAAGVNQTITVPVGPSSVSVDLRVQNDGDLSDTFLVRGPSSNRQFGVRYLRGANDVTGQVVAGTFSTPELAPGARSAVVRLVVTSRPATASGTVRNLAVTFTSTLDATRRDVVVAKAKRS